MGVLLLLCSVLAILGGTAIAVLLGPDGRSTTGPHPIDTDAESSGQSTAVPSSIL
ncbi:MAG: hypothetical protein H0V13_07520 [Nocardioidaceae bacterium]|nr:hypothetical protein [Nocardioidaceae bacterium]